MGKNKDIKKLEKLSEKLANISSDLQEFEGQEKVVTLIEKALVVLGKKIEDLADEEEAEEEPEEGEEK